MPRIAIVTLHGMGKISPTYAEPLRIRLADAFGAQWNEFWFGAVQYQDLLQANQDAVWSRLPPAVSDNTWSELREFLLFGFSDAASLEAGKERPGSVYTQAQERIRSVIAAARDATGGGPLVVVAHSLGAHVFSNYAWDCRQDSPAAGVWKESPVDDPYLRLGMLTRLYSTGCNIPIFVAGHSQVEPFQPVHPDFRWNNYYDPDDVLGWPLDALSEAYRALVTDHAINAGGLFESWNPLSHNEYWSDSDFLIPLETDLRELLAASGGPTTAAEPLFVPPPPPI